MVTLTTSVGIGNFVGVGFGVGSRCPAARLRLGDYGKSLREGEEAIRIKHSVNGNSVKAYGKACRLEGSVFRVETTVQCPEDFKVYRHKEGDRKGPKAWQADPKGAA